MPLLRAEGDRRGTSSEGARREASALALTFCSLFGLNKQNLKELLLMYPAAQEQMHRVAKERAAKYTTSLRAVVHDAAYVNKRLQSMMMARKDNNTPQGDAETVIQSRGNIYEGPMEVGETKVSIVGGSQEACDQTLEEQAVSFLSA